MYFKFDGRNCVQLIQCQILVIVSLFDATLKKASDKKICIFLENAIATKMHGWKMQLQLRLMGRTEV